MREVLFNRSKDRRRFAARNDKLAHKDASAVALAADAAFWGHRD